MSEERRGEERRWVKMANDGSEPGRDDGVDEPCTWIMEKGKADAK